MKTENEYKQALDCIQTWAKNRDLQACIALIEHHDRMQHLQALKALNPEHRPRETPIYNG